VNRERLDGKSVQNREEIKIIVITLLLIVYPIAAEGRNSAHLHDTMNEVLPVNKEEKETFSNRQESNVYFLPAWLSAATVCVYRRCAPPNFNRFLMPQQFCQ